MLMRLFRCQGSYHILCLFLKQYPYLFLRDVYLIVERTHRCDGFYFFCIMPKYKIDAQDRILHNGVWLYRIVATRNIHRHHQDPIPFGEKGGYVEHANNLSHRGECWIYDNAKVFGNARVTGEARIYDYAEISGNAWVRGNATVWNLATVDGDALVAGGVSIKGHAHISEKAVIDGGHGVVVSGHAHIHGNTRIGGNCHVNLGGNTDMSEGTLE